MTVLTTTSLKRIWRIAQQRWGITGSSSTSPSGHSLLPRLHQGTKSCSREQRLGPPRHHWHCILDADSLQFALGDSRMATVDSPGRWDLILSKCTLDSENTEQKNVSEISINVCVYMYLCLCICLLQCLQICLLQTLTGPHFFYKFLSNLLTQKCSK